MIGNEYEAVIGLEVHAELNTKSKIFCSCSTAFGAEPNTQCCPICMGLPGTLPTLNRRAVELAVMAGAALECEISQRSRTDRKQYFYPDLPKAYQISQAGVPLCQNGSLRFRTEAGDRVVGITRIHIEEDAGKLIHKNGSTLIDYNRCGVPLIEIVSAPDMHTGAEAAAYVRALRAVLLTCGISDCRMQEGSLRCDVNISVRRRGDEGFGVRTEIKNINSFAFMEKAIDFEFARQCDLLSRGEEIRMETRRYDSSTGKTYPMRSKERVFDYRFLAEPDLLPICLSQEEIDALRKSLPELPMARARRMEKTYGITESDAEVLSSDTRLADYYETAAKETKHQKLLANLLLTDLMRFCESEPFVSPVVETRLAAVSELFGERVINSATAKKLLARLVEGDFDPVEIVAREGLAQIRDKEALQGLIDEVLVQNPRAVEDYRNGKKAALRSLQGQVMAKSGGRADPILLESLLREAVEV